MLLFLICPTMVISKFDNGVGGLDWGAVMGEEGVEDRAEDTPL